MKRCALYCCDASNHRMFITKDHRGNPFLNRIDAVSYAKEINGTSVYLVTMSKDIELLKP